MGRNLFPDQYHFLGFLFSYFDLVRSKAIEILW